VISFIKTLKHFHAFWKQVRKPLPKCLNLTFTFDLLTSKSNQFMYLHNCTEVVNFVKCPQTAVLTNFQYNRPIMMTHGQPDASSTVLTAADIYVHCATLRYTMRTVTIPARRGSRNCRWGGVPSFPSLSFPFPPLPFLPFHSPPLPSLRSGTP